jgi:hypothetical protein
LSSVFGSAALISDFLCAVQSQHFLPETINSESGNAITSRGLTRYSVDTVTNSSVKVLAAIGKQGVLVLCMWSHPVPVIDNHREMKKGDAKEER